MIRHNSENGARLDGYTRPIFADGGGHDLSLYVKPDANLDGSLWAFDRDALEMIRVNGWLFSITENHSPDEASL